MIVLMKSGSILKLRIQVIAYSATDFTEAAVDEIDQITSFLNKWPVTWINVNGLGDHVIRLMDIIENFRELSSDLMDVYLSSLSNRMNEIMKTLTVIASMFIPLTFIVGIYGMNFDIESSPWNMPELSKVI